MNSVEAKKAEIRRILDEMPEFSLEVLLQHLRNLKKIKQENNDSEDTFMLYFEKILKQDDRLFRMLAAVEDDFEKYDEVFKNLAKY